MAAGKYVLKQGNIIDDVYQKHKDDDGFLYLVYAEENIYGWNWKQISDPVAITLTSILNN